MHLFRAREIEIIHKDRSRRQEFMNHGILKQIPAKAVDISKIVEYSGVIVQFRRPVTELALHDTWKSSCEVGETFTSAITY